MSKLSISTINFIRSNFNKHPIISNGIIYGALFLGAECSQQVLTRKILTETPKTLDYSTLCRYFVYGTTIEGPILTICFKWLDSRFPGTRLNFVMNKVLIDQFVFIPPLVAVFFVYMSITEGKSNIFEECNSKFVQTFTNSCLFWIPVQTLNFLFVPPVYRVIYVGATSFAWANILCYIKRQEY